MFQQDAACVNVAVEKPYCMAQAAKRELEPVNLVTHDHVPGIKLRKSQLAVDVKVMLATATTFKEVEGTTRQIAYTRNEIYIILRPP